DCGDADGPRGRHGAGGPRGQAGASTRRLPRGDVEHPPGAHAVNARVDKPAVRGVRGLVAGLLCALRRRGLGTPGPGGALRAHLRSAPLDADHGGASAGVPRVAVLGCTAWEAHDVSALRGAPGRGKYSSKNSVKKGDQALALLPPPATSRFPPPAVTP